MNTYSKKLIAPLAISAMVMGSLLGAIPAFAHTSPGGCSSTGVSLTLSVFRADGTTPVSGTVAVGETIKYKATLSNFVPGNCDYDGGDLDIFTADAVNHDVDGGSVPLVTSGSPFNSLVVTYVVSAADIGGDGDIDASAVYSGGTSHNSGQNVSPVGATTPTSNVVSGRIIIVKDAINNNAQDFNFNNNFGNGNPATFMLDDDANGTLPNSMSFEVMPGTYAVSEDAVAGWQQESATCDAGETIGSIDVAAGETVTCTFVNEEYARIILVKNTNNGDGTFDFDGTGAGLPTDIDLTTVGGTASQTFNDLDQDNTYSITENVPPGWSLDSATCTGTNTPASISPNPGEEVICTFTNSPILPLEVVKTANTTYDRTWDWTIDKSADETDLLLSEGQSHTVNYDVTVNATSTNVNHMVSGTITITNPAGNPDATVTAVSDVLNSTGAVTVSCDQTLPAVLSAEEVLNCTYSSASNGSDTLNTATVTTSGSVLGNSDDAEVVWGAPANEIDECVDVTDSNDTDGVLTDTICANETLPYTYEYGLTFGPDTNVNTEVIVACGESDHLNTARVIELDSSVVRQDTWNVNVNVDCFQGCTLTQGYWKTHSYYGKAPYDDNWAELTNGADTQFLNLTGVSWYQLFWMSPAGGNAFVQLAHQWMAATLNVLNGASTTPAVDSALTTAQDLLDNYPSVPTAKNISKPLQQQMRDLAGTLGSYNEGLIGPGHCDEQNP